MLTQLLRSRHDSRHDSRPSTNRRPLPFRESSIRDGNRPSTLENRAKIAVNYDDYDSNEDEDEARDSDFEEDEGDDEDEHDDDEDLENSRMPLLPIFESSHLDSIPIYRLTHTIRVLIASRCETTLSWDQLRSPQVSQFLIKPIQKALLSSHFSRATLYALLANCLQFTKEIETQPGISGASRTRAMACELLAIRLLKEYSTRELIDALSYDFYPLQGMEEEGDAGGDPFAPVRRQNQSQARPGRISTLEVAIRAQAKRFLAHPLVVQHLEAVWAGAIVFYSAADNLHRQPKTAAGQQNEPRATPRYYGSFDENTAQPRFSSPAAQPPPPAVQPALGRRAVKLYDPRDASVFKLSRLRVPRYRHFLGTCSLGILLVLYVAVLQRHSQPLTTLEMVFWLWGAGFMLDEVLGFNEQGFSLYIMSFWNAFDLGILLVFFLYYCLRIAGWTAHGKEESAALAQLAYDILGVNAVLLFPRVFSVLDHSRYFSQLLIAFRMMMFDLLAILALIVIACSGFFVAFSLSFDFENDDIAPSGNAFALFQMLMGKSLNVNAACLLTAKGFTPTAWEHWERYNIIGRTTLVIFLFITHFLVVTILITVLTNSFMAIVRNAHDEHQFVFAINTISMVKSDALFSYVAPTNLLGWLLAPLRFCMPFKQFVSLNRTVIKTTHFPILLGIYVYERLVLEPTFYEPTDLVEQGPQRPRMNLAVFDRPGGSFSLQNRTTLKKERSVATFQKDQALDEVFRRPLSLVGGDSHRSPTRRKSENVVHNWMQDIDPEDAEQPPEQDTELLANLEKPRGSLRGSRVRSVGYLSAARSATSDPEHRYSFLRDGRIRGKRARNREESLRFIRDPDDDDDGDDDPDLGESAAGPPEDIGDSDREATTRRMRRASGRSGPRRSILPVGSPRGRRETVISFDETGSYRPSRVSRPLFAGHQNHAREPSTNTILYNPIEHQQPTDSSVEKDEPMITDEQLSPKQKPKDEPKEKQREKSPAKKAQEKEAKPKSTAEPMKSGETSSLLSPKRPTTSRTNTAGTGIASAATAARPKPIPLPGGNRGAADFFGAAGMVPFEDMQRWRRRDRSALALDLASDLGDNKAFAGGWGLGGLGGGGGMVMMPASFATQILGAGSGRFDRGLAAATGAAPGGGPGIPAPATAAVAGAGNEKPKVDKPSKQAQQQQAFGQALPLPPFLHQQQQQQQRQQQQQFQRLLAQEREEQQRMMSKLVLARMNTLEEGFREVLREVRQIRRAGDSKEGSERGGTDGGGGDEERKRGRSRRGSRSGVEKAKEREERAKRRKKEEEKEKGAKEKGKQKEVEVGDQNQKGVERGENQKPLADEELVGPMGERWSSV